MHPSDNRGLRLVTNNFQAHTSKSLCCCNIQHATVCFNHIMSHSIMTAGGTVIVAGVQLLLLVVNETCPWWKRNRCRKGELCDECSKAKSCLSCYRRGDNWKWKEIPEHECLIAVVSLPLWMKRWNPQCSIVIFVVRLEDRGPNLLKRNRCISITALNERAQKRSRNS